MGRNAKTENVIFVTKTIIVMSFNIYPNVPTLIVNVLSSSRMLIQVLETFFFFKEIMTQEDHDAYQHDKQLFIEISLR